MGDKGLNNLSQKAAGVTNAEPQPGNKYQSRQWFGGVSGRFHASPSKLLLQAGNW